jgi:hypothetical protein
MQWLMADYGVLSPHTTQLGTRGSRIRAHSCHITITSGHFQCHTSNNRKAQWWDLLGIKIKSKSECADRDLILWRKLEQPPRARANKKLKDVILFILYSYY